MEQDMMETADFGYFELVRRLEAYADLRLSPSVAATTRMRKAVMTAAHRRAALIAADAMFETTAATTTVRAERATRAHAGLPQNLPLIVWIDRVDHAGLLSGHERPLAVPERYQDRRRREIEIRRGDIGAVRLVRQAARRVPRVTGRHLPRPQDLSCVEVHSHE